jgi:hypothetical protein
MSANINDLIRNCDLYASITVLKDAELYQPYETIEWWKTPLYPIVYLEINDSMEMHYRTATCIIYDTAKIRELLPLTGNEIISIKFKNLAHNQNLSTFSYKVIHFRIFSLEEEQNKQKSNNPNEAFLQLNLIEFPAFEMLSCQTVYRTFSWSDTRKTIAGITVPTNLLPTRISDMVRNLLASVPNFAKWWLLSIDDTTIENEFNFYSPNWKLTTSLSYLTQFAQTALLRYPNYFFKTRSPMKFGQKPIFMFKSLHSFLLDKSYRNYFLNRMDTYESEYTNSAKSRETDVIQYDPVDVMYEPKLTWGNGMQVLSNIVGETVISSDVVDGINYLRYDIKNLIEDYKGMGSRFLTTKNPLNTTAKNFQWVNFKTIPWSSKKIAKIYLKNSFFRKYVINGPKLTCVGSTNELRNVGEKCNIQLNGSLNTTNDKMFSGKWILWETKEIFLGTGISTTEMTFLKDSFNELPEDSKTIIPQIKNDNLQNII